MKRRLIIIFVILAVAGGVYYEYTREPSEITLTGIVTTDQVIVSPEIQGRLQQLLVKEGDTVTTGQLLAVIKPESQEADVDYYVSSEQQAAAQVTQAQADLENARLVFERNQSLVTKHAVSDQEFDQARTAYDGVKARVDSLNRQVEAAAAQKKKSMVLLGYTQIHSPVNAIVDTRAALQGEVVNPGQAIVTLINPDDLWVRADVEETYIDRIRLGDTLQVRLPSGATLPGKVFYRSVDADFATQRDVSHTKRDIRTFEIRLRCDNTDRRLAVGMTAYVDLTLGKP